MKSFLAILFVTILTISLSAAGPAGSAEDFHTIDENGGYHFGYNDGRIARQEERSPEGIIRGAYTYVDAEGQVQVVTYTADKHNGFLVSGTNIPRVGRIPEVGEVGEIIEETPAAVVDTAEVAAARAEHAAAFNRAVLGEIPSVPVPVAVVQPPLPVAETPEVAAARAEHLAAHGLLRNGGVTVQTQFHPDYLPYAAL